MMHHRPYTLIEVLAAVAVLVLMMSFLFQFTSGAQRIWSASNTHTAIADNAEAILSLLNEDLSQMQVDGELGMGYSIAASGATSGDFAFYTLSTRTMGNGATDAKVGSLLYVKYDYDASDKKLYRFQVNAENGMYDASNNLIPDGEVIGFSSILNDADEKKKYLVADGVEFFEVRADSASAANELPGFIRVNIRLDNPNKRSNEKSSVAKSYSQVFFVGMK